MITLLDEYEALHILQTSAYFHILCVGPLKFMVPSLML